MTHRSTFDDASGTPPARGRLVVMDDVGQGQDFILDDEPLVIGSGDQCGVRLPASLEVAPRHAVVWMRGDRVMLRHTGGPRRMTMVGQKTVDWMILEDGDDFRVGPHRFRVELSR